MKRPHVVPTRERGQVFLVEVWEWWVSFVVLFAKFEIAHGDAISYSPGHELVYSYDNDLDR